MADSKTASPLRELTWQTGSHSVACHPAEVTFLFLRQPNSAGTRFWRPLRDARRKKRKRLVLIPWLLASKHHTPLLTTIGKHKIYITKNKIN